jgi:hypothetical protein
MTNLILVLSLCAAFLIPAREISTSQPIVGEPLVAAGDLAVSVEPYRLPDADTMPVQVSAAEGSVSADGWLAIRNVRVRNRSDKPVQSVRISLYLIGEQDPKKILASAVLNKGKYAYPGFEAGDEMLYSTRISTNLLTGKLALLKSVMKDGILEGKYSILVGVSRVEFRDSGSWEFKEPAGDSES